MQRHSQQRPIESDRRVAEASPDAGAEEFPNRVISGIELAEKIKKGQFKVGKLGGPTASMPEIWRAALAAQTGNLSIKRAKPTTASCSLNLHQSP